MTAIKPVKVPEVLNPTARIKVIVHHADPMWVGDLSRVSVALQRSCICARLQYNLNYYKRNVMGHT